MRKNTLTKPPFMKPLAATLLGLMLSLLSYAQSFNWLTEIKSIYKEDIKESLVLPNGEVVITGAIESIGDIHFGNIIPPSLYDSIQFTSYFTAKCDTLGNFLWVKQGGGGAYNSGGSVTTDNNQNVYSAGYSSGNACFDDTCLGYPVMGEKNILIKYDAAGSLKWIHRFGNVTLDQDYDVSGQCVRYSNGHIYNFAGIWQFGPLTVFSDTLSATNGDYHMCYLTKFDTAGNFIFSKNLFTSSSTVLEIREVVPVGDNFIVTGFFGEDLTIDTTTYTLPPGQYQSFVAKYNSLGELLWFKLLSKNKCTNFITDIDLDDKRNIFAAGLYYDTLIVESTEFINPSSIYPYSFLCRFDSAGNLLWEKNFYGPGLVHCSALCISQNSTYLSGHYSGYLHADNQTLFNDVGFNLFILKLDSLGNTVKSETHGTTNLVDVMNIGSNTEGQLYFTGNYLNSTVIGPYHLFADSIPSSMWNETDAFIFKYDPWGTPSAVSITRNEQLSITVYPNPFNNNLSITVSNSSISNFTLVNFLGQKVLNQSFTNSTTIVTEQLEAGIYFYELENSERVVKGKIVKQ